MIIFFYAGHGAMHNNQQILVLNGDTNVKTKIRKTEDGKEFKEKIRTVEYTYDIENKWKSRFT